MNDPYAWWRGALENQAAIGKALPVHEGDPQSGFYRKRKFKDGPWQAVAIWTDTNGETIALVDGATADAFDIWTFCCRNPVSEAAYRKAAAGEGWNDEPPAAVGHNSQNMPADPHERLAMEFEAEKEQAEAFLKEPVTSKDRADMAAVWSKRLSEIAKKATDLHKVEKQPHLDAGRAVDDKWRELKEAPKALSTRLKRALDDFLRAEARKEEERQRKAREEAERLRREAEEAARKASAQENAEAEAEAERIARHAAEAEREAEARNAQAGRTGAKVALRTFVSAEITDFDALLLALKDRAEVMELVQSLANRAAKSGVELPGMRIKEEKRAA